VRGAVVLLENSTVLHNHNADEAIGRVLDSKAVSGGLFLNIMISKTAPEKWQQIKEGVLNKFSVRGKVIEARKRWVAELKRHARIILKMQLVEVSLVAVPANPKARAVRWYVEKALDEFEKAGGLLDSGAKAMAGGFPMKEEREVEKGFPGEVSEELIEASGETRDEAGQPEKPAAAQKDGAAGGGGVLALIEKLISGETDLERKKALEQVRDALKQPPVSKAAAGEGGIEKAGRKVSSARLKRLKSLLEELKSLVSEVDDNSDDKEAKKTADAGGDGPSDKITEIEGTIGKIAQALLAVRPGERPALELDVPRHVRLLRAEAPAAAGVPLLRHAHVPGRADRPVGTGHLFAHRGSLRDRHARRPVRTWVHGVRSTASRFRDALRSPLRVS
jgi:HK97 family phage prohead protease